MSDDLELYVAPLNGRPYRLVQVKQAGKEIFRDSIDVNSAWAREKFAEKVAAKYSGPAKRFVFQGNYDIHGLEWLPEKLVELADAADEKALAENVEGFAAELPIFQRITCPELDAAEYTVEYLCRWILTAGQPCIFAGGKKTLKTSLLIALAIALATGRPFLGFFEVPRAVRVLMMSGESGLPTIQETARRIAHSMSLELAEIGNLIFSPSLPRFGDALHKAALEKMLTDDEIEVLMIDPAYLCMPTEGGESSLFAMGDLMTGIIEACQRCGVTLILAHHTKKGVVDPYAPPELEHIAFAGFAEIARQWILVGRQERYEPGSGLHRLWLNCGGSAGHSSCHALTIEEGAFDGTTPRFWSVDVMKAEEARQDVNERVEAAKRAKKDQELESDKREIVQAAAKWPMGETLTTIRNASGVRNPRFGRALAALISNGDLLPVEIVKGNARKYEGYKLGGQS